MKEISRRKFLEMGGSFLACRFAPNLILPANTHDGIAEQSREVEVSVPFLQEDLAVVGFSDLASEKIIKATPYLIRAEENMRFFEREKTGEREAVPWEVTLSFLGMENSFGMYTENPNGPYQLVKKTYPPTKTEDQFLQATYDAAHFLKGLGEMLNINPQTDGEVEKIPRRQLAILAANYNGLTPPVYYKGRPAYGNPKDGERYWAYSAYVLNNYNETARAFGYPHIILRNGTVVNTHQMPVRITYPYPVPLPEESQDRYFTSMQRDGFLTILSRLEQAKKIALEREEKIKDDKGTKIGI